MIKSITLMAKWTSVWLILLLGFANAKGKKPEPPRQTFPNSKLINRSCQAVWSAAMPIMTQAGFTPQTMERESGVASFTYNKQSSEFASTNDAKLYTTAPVGFWTKYRAFGVQSANLTVSPEVGACTCQIAINFVGLQQTIAGAQWVAMPSNGSAENALLQRIQEKAQLSEATPGTIVPPLVTKVPEGPMQPNVIQQPSPPNPVVQESQKAVVMNPAATTVRIVCPENVNQVPLSSGRPDRRTLKCDEPVTILSESQNWIRVKTADGIEGYVAPKFVAKP